MRTGRDATYAIRTVKVVTLFSVGVEFTGSGEDGDFAAACGG